MDKQKGTKKTFITRSKIQTGLDGSGIDVSKDTTSRALNRTGLVFRSPREMLLLKLQHIKPRLKFVETYDEKRREVWETVIWSDEIKIELLGRNTATRVWRKNGTSHNNQNSISKG